MSDCGSLAGLARQHLQQEHVCSILLTHCPALGISLPRHSYSHPSFRVHKTLYKPVGVDPQKAGGREEYKLSSALYFGLLNSVADDSVHTRQFKSMAAVRLRHQFSHCLFQLSGCFATSTTLVVLKDADCKGTPLNPPRNTLSTCRKATSEILVQTYLHLFV